MTNLPSTVWWAVPAAAVAAFVVGAVWNSPLLFGPARERLAGLPPQAKINPAQPVAELARCLILSASIAALIIIVGPRDVPTALGLGFFIWLGFQATLLTGGVIWEKMPPPLFAIHAGDALVKMLLVSGLLAILL